MLFKKDSIFILAIILCCVGQTWGMEAENNETEYFSAEEYNEEERTANFKILRADKEYQGNMNVCHQLETNPTLRGYNVNLPKKLEEALQNYINEYQNSTDKLIQSQVEEWKHYHAILNAKHPSDSQKAFSEKGEPANQSISETLAFQKQQKIIEAMKEWEGIIYKYYNKNFLSSWFFNKFSTFEKAAVAFYGTTWAYLEENNKQTIRLQTTQVLRDAIENSLLTKQETIDKFKSYLETAKYTKLKKQLGEKLKVKNKTTINKSAAENDPAVNLPPFETAKVPTEPNLENSEQLNHQLANLNQDIQIKLNTKLKSGASDNLSTAFEQFETILEQIKTLKAELATSDEVAKDEDGSDQAQLKKAKNMIGNRFIEKINSYNELIKNLQTSPASTPLFDTLAQIMDAIETFEKNIRKADFTTDGLTEQLTSTKQNIATLFAEKIKEYDTLRKMEIGTIENIAEHVASLTTQIELGIIQCNNALGKNRYNLFGKTQEIKTAIEYVERIEQYFKNLKEQLQRLQKNNQKDNALNIIYFAVTPCLEQLNLFFVAVAQNITNKKLVPHQADYDIYFDQARPNTYKFRINDINNETTVITDKEFLNFESSLLLMTNAQAAVEKLKTDEFASEATQKNQEQMLKPAQNATALAWEKAGLAYEQKYNEMSQNKDIKDETANVDFEKIKNRKTALNNVNIFVREYNTAMNEIESAITTKNVPQNNVTVAAVRKAAEENFRNALTIVNYINQNNKSSMNDTKNIIFNKSIKDINLENDVTKQNKTTFNNFIADQKKKITNISTTNFPTNQTDIKNQPTRNLTPNTVTRTQINTVNRAPKEQHGVNKKIPKKISEKNLKLIANVRKALQEYTSAHTQINQSVEMDYQTLQKQNNLTEEVLEKLNKIKDQKTLVRGFHKLVMEEYIKMINKFLQNDKLALYITNPTIEKILQNAINDFTYAITILNPKSTDTEIKEARTKIFDGKIATLVASDQLHKPLPLINIKILTTTEFGSLPAYFPSIQQQFELAIKEIQKKHEEEKEKEEEEEEEKEEEEEAAAAAEKWPVKVPFTEKDNVQKDTKLTPLLNFAENRRNEYQNTLTNISANINDSKNKFSNTVKTDFNNFANLMSTYQNIVNPILQNPSTQTYINNPTIAAILSSTKNNFEHAKEILIGIATPAEKPKKPGEQDKVEDPTEEQNRAQRNNMMLAKSQIFNKKMEKIPFKELHANNKQKTYTDLMAEINGIKLNLTKHLQRNLYKQK
ncbi:hypothetical protein IPH67_04755 [bacterium]|nr:MAG: hypothetical protein IPH67_04755 [bacterium]